MRRKYLSIYHYTEHVKTLTKIKFKHSMIIKVEQSHTNNKCLGYRLSCIVLVFSQPRFQFQGITGSPETFPVAVVGGNSSFFSSAVQIALDLPLSTGMEYLWAFTKIRGV